MENLVYLRRNILNSEMNSRNHRYQAWTTNDRYNYLYAGPNPVLDRTNTRINKNKITNLIKKIVLSKYNEINDNKIFTIFCSNEIWDNSSTDGLPQFFLRRSAETSGTLPCLLLSSQSSNNEIDDYYMYLSSIFLKHINKYELERLNGTYEIKNYLLFSYDNFDWWTNLTIDPDIKHVELDDYSNFVIRNTTITPKTYFLSPELARNATDIEIAHLGKDRYIAEHPTATPPEFEGLGNMVPGGSRRKTKRRSSTKKRQNTKSRLTKKSISNSSRKNKHTKRRNDSKKKNNRA
jgi:hypothetical protein